MSSLRVFNKAPKSEKVIRPMKASLITVLSFGTVRLTSYGEVLVLGLGTWGETVAMLLRPSSIVGTAIKDEMDANPQGWVFIKSIAGGKIEDPELLETIRDAAGRDVNVNIQNSFECQIVDGNESLVTYAFRNGRRIEAFVDKIGMIVNNQFSCVACSHRGKCSCADLPADGGRHVCPRTVATNNIEEFVARNGRKMSRAKCDVCEATMVRAGGMRKRTEQHDGLTPYLRVPVPPKHVRCLGCGQKTEMIMPRAIRKVEGQLKPAYRGRCQGCGKGVGSPVGRTLMQPVTPDAAWKMRMQATEGEGRLKALIAQQEKEVFEQKLENLLARFV